MKRSLLIAERRMDPDALPKHLMSGKTQAKVIHVLPGEMQLSNDPDALLVTTLGSCVSACVRDPRTGYGGMNHFMLPLSRDDLGTWGGVSRSLRYGNHAMESLINQILRTGCARQALEIKLFGGGNVMQGRTDIGHNNARFVLEYIENEALKVAAADLGGMNARRIYYAPATGSVKRLLLRRRQDGHTVQDIEKNYEQRLQILEEDTDDNIELFAD